MPLLGPNGAPLTEQAAPEPVQPEAPSGPIPCTTAFIVYKLPDGRWQVADDLDAPLVPDRKPHGDDFTAGCAIVQRDVATQETAIQAANLIIPNTAQAVVNAQMQLGKQVAEAQQAARVAQQIEAERHAKAGRR